MFYNQELIDSIKVNELYDDKKIHKEGTIYISPYNLGEFMVELAKSYADLSSSMIVRRTGINKSTLSKIINNKDYVPSKDTVIQFIFAYKIEYKTAEVLLNRAGYSLNSFNSRDLLISYFIEEGMYDLNSLNYCLMKNNLKEVRGR